LNHEGHEAEEHMQTAFVRFVAFVVKHVRISTELY